MASLIALLADLLTLRKRCHICGTRLPYRARRHGISYADGTTGHAYSCNETHGNHACYLDSF